MTCATDIPHSLAWRAKNAEKNVWGTGVNTTSYEAMDDSHAINAAIMIMKAALVRTAKTTLSVHEQDLSDWYADEYFEDDPEPPYICSLFGLYSDQFANDRDDGYKPLKRNPEEHYRELAFEDKFIERGNRLVGTGAAAKAALILMLMDYYGHDPLDLAPEAEPMTKAAYLMRPTEVGEAIEMVFYDLRTRWAMVLELLYTDSLVWTEYGGEDG